VTLVRRRLQVVVVALQLLAGIGAQLQDVHAPAVLKSCEGPGSPRAQVSVSASAGSRWVRIHSGSDHSSVV
jgi:hypothetical protein